jgi:hypothetical protein
MASDPFELLLARMAATGVASGDELVGCTAAEIRLERRYSVALPATYRRFLEQMGRRSGKLFTHDWVSCNAPGVFGATARLRKELAGSGLRDTLPADAVVILARDGEQYNFIRCDRADDSPVWALDLGALRVRPRQFRSSILGWLRAWAKEAAEAVASGWYERKRG